MGERKNSSSFFMIFILIIPFGSFFVTHTLCCYCVLWVLFLLSTQRRMRIFKPGKQTRQTLTRTREEKGFSFSNLLLLQGPKKTEFRGNSSSWGCCIRVIEKSHIFCRVLFKMIEKSHIFQNIFDWNKYVSVWSCIFPCFEIINVHRMLCAAFIWRIVHYTFVCSYSICNIVLKIVSSCYCIVLL